MGILYRHRVYETIVWVGFTGVVQYAVLVHVRTVSKIIA